MKALVSADNTSQRFAIERNSGRAVVLLVLLEIHTASVYHFKSEQQSRYGPQAFAAHHPCHPARARFLRLPLSAGVKGLKRRAARRQGDREG
jgi:hypothetical protein